MIPKISNISISKLTLLDKNPRKITKEQFEKLCNNIKNDPEFLSARPILIHSFNEKLEVYAGNQRVRAAKKLGWKEVPCIIDTTITDEIKKKRIVLDNLHHGEFDWDLLSASYDPQELLDLGFTDSDLEIPSYIPESVEEDESAILEPVKDEDAITKPGDIYELNQHRLVCGDSTNPEDVAKCLNGNEPILMVTDPPYGVEYDPKWRNDVKGAHKPIKAAGKVQNDDRVNWSLSWHLFPGSVAYIWCASWFLPEVAKSLDECEYERKSLIIWVKQHFALSRGDYHWQHEPCWYAVKKGHSHNWQGSRKESTIWEISNLNCFGKSQDEDVRTAHSTQKPLECMDRPIRNNTAQGEGVYDPFLGSGTTLIAAEQLSRICYGIEISPAYCDIIVNRWKNFMVKNGRDHSIKKNGTSIKGN